MGTWGTGVFDDDVAADWAGDLTDAPAWQRPWRVRWPLVRAIGTRGHLSRDAGATALAAAAVVAATCPDGPALDGVYGPDPQVVARLRTRGRDRELAARAVRRVLGPSSEWMELWEDAGAGDAAEQELRPVLEALRRS